MLDLLDQSLEAFLREVVPLSKRQVEVSFEAPDSDWGSKVNKPTVNLFLWDVRKNMEERQSGMQLMDDGNGRKIRTLPKPRVDCRYLVTAWTAEVRDEHQLLGSLLAALLRHDEVPAEFIQGAYEPVRPLPSLSVAGPDGRDNSDFWSALGGQLKPGLDLVVTATVDLVFGHAAGPPVERYEVGLADRRRSNSMSRRLSVGGRVDPADRGKRAVTPRGSTTVDDRGEFLVRGEVGDTVEVDGARAGVPEKGHVSFGRSKRKRAGE